jgi:hypothetical protein
MSETTSDVVYLSDVRLSFPKIVEPSAFQEGGAKKFSADFIIVPNSENAANFMAAVGAIALEKWKEHAQTILQICQNDRKLRCYGNGAERLDKKSLKPYNGYEGMMYVGASSNDDRPPQIINGKGKVAEGLERLELARKLYGGCYVNAVVRPWTQDNQYGRAIRCELKAIQFLRDGEAFGENPTDVTGMFKPVEGGAVPAVPFPSFMS